MSFDYKLHKVESMPPSLYYIPEFVTKAEEIKLLDDIDKTSSVKWTQLSNRRLQNWGGVPHPKVWNHERINDIQMILLLSSHRE